MKKAVSMPLRVIFRRLLCESIVVFSLLSCKDERICVVKPHSPVDTDPVKTTCYADLGAIISLTKVNDGFVASFHRDTLLFGWLDKEMRLRQRFCRRGNGPGEMVAPVYCGQYSVCDGNAVISVLDRPKSTLYSYQITEEEVKMCPESVTFSRDQEGLRKVFHVNGGWLILSDDTTQGVYISSEDGQEIKPVEIPDRKPSYLIPGVYQTSSTIRPDSSIVALAYYLLPRIDLIGADGTCRKVIYFDKRRRALQLKNDQEDYFIDICCNNDRIYALAARDDASCTLVSLDWMGNVVSNQLIKRAYSICLDGNNLLALSDDGTGLMVSCYRI